MPDNYQSEPVEQQATPYRVVGMPDGVDTVTMNNTAFCALSNANTYLSNFMNRYRHDGHAIPEDIQHAHVVLSDFFNVVQGVRAAVAAGVPVIATEELPEPEPEPMSTLALNELTLAKRHFELFLNEQFDAEAETPLTEPEALTDAFEDISALLTIAQRERETYDNGGGE